MFVACFNMHMVSFPCVLACVRRLCVVFQHRRFRRCSGKRSCRPRRVPWRLPGMRASYFMSFSMHMPHAMPRARTCEAHARSVCASSVRWHALLGAQVPVRVPFFACTIFSMLRNDIFDMHAACHTKSLPCRRARPDLRADARSAPQSRSDLVRRNTGAV